MKRLLLIVLPLLLIVGCSKSVDDSTLIKKDGLMYLPESDKPYTGEVFRNYSSGEKLYQGIYEDGQLVDFSYLKKDGSLKEPINYETTLDERDSMYYTKDTNIPYSGSVFSLYDDGIEKEKGYLKSGKKDGFWVAYSETDYEIKGGNKIAEGNFINGKKDGQWFFYYNATWDSPYDGSVYQMLTFKNDKANGLANNWYKNGVKEAEGNLKNDNPIGSWTFWHKNGEKKSEEYYKIFSQNDNGDESLKDGVYTDWHENGEKKSEGKFKNGEKVGQWVSWYDNGKKENQGSFENGNLTGLWTFWHENGKKKSEEHYKIFSRFYGGRKIINGDESLKDGLYTDYHENGAKKSEGTFIEGYKYKNWIFWYENGQKSREGKYTDGHRLGLWTEWYENGQKKTHGEYRRPKYGELGYRYSNDEKNNAKKTGIWTEWYDNGQKKSEGVLKTVKGTYSGEYERRFGLWNEWHKNGQKKLEHNYTGYGSLYTTWYENGQKKSEGKKDNGEKKKGVWTEWYENGQKKEEGKHDGREKKGVWTEWYENGQKKSEGEKNGFRPKGKWTYWHENGQIKMVGKYYEIKGTKIGLWLEYYENGMKKSEKVYKNSQFKDIILSEKYWDEKGKEKK